MGIIGTCAYCKFWSDPPKNDWGYCKEHKQPMARWGECLEFDSRAEYSHINFIVQ